MNQNASIDLTRHLRDAAQNAPESGIVAVANHGRSNPGVIPLWVGEGDAPTPPFITRPTEAALENGETFYTWQRGLPDLRAALAGYHSRLFGRSFEPSQFIVTGGGMQAIQLAIQATAGAGDEILYLTPAWPNFAGAAGIAGVRPQPVSLDFGDNGWSLDIDKLARSVTPQTRAIFFNSPSNPTGWTATRDDIQAVLGLARQHGLWIIADEIYTRFYYDGPRAPSFLDVMHEDDRVIFVNTFSKNWAMTGWRIGWVMIPPSLQQVFENLVQYSTSGVASFMQRGAVAALDQGDDFVQSQVSRAQLARDIVSVALAKTGRARFAVPPGAFYLFFAVDGVTNSLNAAIRLIDETNVGLAPGSAFMAPGEGWFRLCFNRRIDQIEEASRRLSGWIRSL
jgi:aspartate/methionine/tyrosine aminotransferase